MLAQKEPLSYGPDAQTNARISGRYLKLVRKASPKTVNQR